MADYLKFCGMSLRNASKPFSRNLWMMSLWVLILGAGGFLGFMPWIVTPVEDWLKEFDHSMADWYASYPWIILILWLAAYIAAWGTYGTYLDERMKRENMQDLFNRLQDKDAQREKR
ncbi:MAG: hypothetical protein V3R87_06975 [Dehalococcoidia bacterium]